MKSLLLGIAIIAAATLNNVNAKQEDKKVSPSPRVVSQEDGLTAQDQSNKPADLAVVKQIRRELMKDDALSTKAKNVKIIVLNNGVTLKGPVTNDMEMERILKHAYVTAPKHKIYNQISVVK
jgi:osmotically-inducible protein OsmY